MRTKLLGVLYAFRSYACLRLVEALNHIAPRSRITWRMHDIAVDAYLRKYDHLLPKHNVLIEMNEEYRLSKSSTAGDDFF